jgi:outer membrane protein TolC
MHGRIEMLLRRCRRALACCLIAGVGVAGQGLARADPPAPAGAPRDYPDGAPVPARPAPLPAACPTPTGEPASAPFVAVGPSPSGADVAVLPIDLPTALRLVNASNPTIALARARVEEAYARLREAQVMWLPNLEAGPSYLRHDGILQTSRGEVIPVSKWSLFAGGGAALRLETSEALFAPLIARRLVQAQAAASEAVADDIQLNVALAYLDLLRTYGALSINAESLANAQEMTRLAEAAERAGFGKTPADANRGRTEVALRRQERIDLEAQAGVASARLAQLLLLDPTADLRPSDAAVLPIALMPTDAPLDELVATGLMARPELAESRALVAAALARWRRARVGPLLPRLEVSYFAGEFGGGMQDSTQRFGGRGDGAAEAIWTLHSFGVGDLARSQVGRAQYNQATAHVVEVQAQVAAEVTAWTKVVRNRQRTLAEAERGVAEAERMWRRLLRMTLGVGLPAAKYEAVELLTAEQQLNQARLQYLDEVIEYDKAQFRLYTALGQPALEALPKACALPVSAPPAPVTPVPRSAPEPRKGPPVKEEEPRKPG